jgi:hypothetical protein
MYCLYSSFVPFRLLLINFINLSWCIKVKNKNKVIYKLTSSQKRFPLGKNVFKTQYWFLESD